ncbi:hypothetical protein HanXRQr2_Chr01g0044961 [Helianthus annuus]|uniref:Uncharacterized protein n=1 Tax=Helianthus annuus TaxID=4232 RepID=A0A9K3JZA0_HELAN|nr:hypothetical protein HanXRQr2_Chr01g0044961 [Helianthus annuus]KAJ0958964.1 hypothetical protein HanPSC8_Chr01g0044691 [Helianthus annuus]
MNEYDFQYLSTFQTVEIFPFQNPIPFCLRLHLHCRLSSSQIICHHHKTESQNHHRHIHHCLVS